MTTEPINPEIQKFVFDPLNPKDFAVYNLLLRIVKEKNNQVLFDFNFLLEIFKEQIFDKEFDEHIWDKPKNYWNLSSHEKVNTFIKNYTLADFKEYIIKKVSNYSNKKVQLLGDQIFPVNDFVFEKTNNGDMPFFEAISKKTTEILNSQKAFESQNYFLIFANVDTNRKEELRKKINQWKPTILFIKNGYKHLLSYFDFPITSIVITTITDFEEISTHPAYKNDSIKPILLKKIEDIHLLLDILYRDATASNSTENNGKSISYLESVSIQNYFSIKNRQISNLGDKKEIYFLGENGDGKTILLQSILLSIKGNQSEGKVHDVVKYNPEMQLTATDSEGIEYQYNENAKEQGNSYKNIFAYGVNRNNFHKTEKDKTGYLTLFSNKEYLESPVQWLIYLDHKEAKGLPVVVSLNEAKEMIRELLDRNVEIEVTPDNVTFTERGTPLEFEQLSDGYKSVISWTGDLITRLAENQPNAKSLNDFKGIVLVDEIDMFLHPKWEYTLVGKLRKMFKGIQFIFSTHSPMLILGASEDAVFYKVYKEDGETKISEPWLGKDMLHLMANGIITSPLFDLESARMSSFDELKHQLDTAPNYLYSQISAKIKEQIAAERNAGKSYISRQEIDKIVENAISIVRKEVRND